MLSLGTLALLTAAFLLAELIQRSDDERLPEPLDGERFSLSAPVLIAASIVLGGWPAALIGAVGTLIVRPLKGEPWRKAFVRAAGLAVAALAGGFAFQLAGSTPGSLDVSQDLLSVVVLGTVYGAIRSLSAALAGGRVLPQLDVVTTAAEVGLGLLIAFAALENLWLVAALAPVLLLLDQIYGRLMQLRREMATALETFANIVDERDSSTHGHSLRVAGYVQELATGVGLPRSDVSRLWWAGRLHDLGKVAVDASVLRKPSKLTPNEWGAVWRAPRLSARLLQRFRFAAQQAQAELTFEPTGGGDAVAVQRRFEVSDGRLLRVADRQSSPVEGQVPGELMTDRPLTGMAPVEQDRPTVITYPEVAELPVAVQKGLWGLEDRL